MIYIVLVSYVVRVDTIFIKLLTYDLLYMYSHTGYVYIYIYIVVRSTFLEGNRPHPFH